MKLIAITMLLLTLVSPVAMAADTYKIDKSHSEALFRIRHLMSKVTGRFSDFDGTMTVDSSKPESSSVEFRIRTNSIDTNEPKRDKHLRSAEFFDVEKYPELTFKSKSIKSVGKNAFDVAGNLTMRGVTKPVTVRVDYLGNARDPWGNERAGFEVTTTLNRKDYGLLWNQRLDTGGYLLDDDVQVTINVEAIKQKPAEKAAPGR